MNHFRQFLLAAVVCTIFQIHLQAQDGLQRTDNQYFRIAFYNVENLFDVYDDPSKNDDEFLPKGARKWDNRRFYKKLNNIYRVIISMGEWHPPGIVGLCEVENRFVLNQLLSKTPLNRFDYRIIHFESPDFRGIDVALIYRPIHFMPDTFFIIPVSFPFDPGSTTRDILYVKGRLVNEDTLHLFVNHWPSRYGGYLETKPKRESAAGILRHKVDSLLRLESVCNIIIMGDFNDNPVDKSLSEILGAGPFVNHQSELVNLIFHFTRDSRKGTLKFRENWDIFDQFIVTGSMLTGSGKTMIDPPEAVIFEAGFLTEPDQRWGGIRPLRTYNGYSYQGGYSDHLPVYINLRVLGN
jgi:hypothetical protein